MVNKMGLSNLPPELKSLLPSVDLTVERHKQIFAESIAQYGGHGDMNTDSFQRMYETQTLWDEYMSESAVNYLRNFPDSTLVLIAGRGHIKGRVAIPDRISKRLSGNAAEPFVIVPEEVDWSAENGLPVVVAPPETTECDWAWYTQKEIKA